MQWRSSFRRAPAPPCSSAANSTLNNYTSQLLGFAALQYLLAGQLFIKAEFALASAYFQPSDLTVPVWSNYMYNGTIRLMYLY